jgi:hypothetical protein
VFGIAGIRTQVDRSPDGSTFAVLFEGEAKIEGYRPLLAGFPLPDIRSFDLELSDGALEIDFVACLRAPSIARIEIEAIAP